MRKLDLTQKKIKHGEEDGEELKREKRHNKSEGQGNYCIVARAAEEKVAQLMKSSKIGR